MLEATSPKDLACISDSLTLDILLASFLFDSFVCPSPLCVQVLVCLKAYLTQTHGKSNQLPFSPWKGTLALVHTFCGTTRAQCHQQREMWEPKKWCLGDVLLITSFISFLSFAKMTLSVFHLVAFLSNL